MSSRVEHKAAARRQRVEFEAATQRAAQRRRSVVRLGAVAAAALVLVAGAVAVSRPGGEEAAVSKAAATAGSYVGLPQDGIALGAAQAPATLVEFADLQCPFCAVYAVDVLPSVMDRYVRPGDLRLELNVLTFVGEDSIRAGRMAAAAAQQDRMWHFADAFYANQGTENTGYATDDFLRTTAVAAGLDVAAAERAQGEAAATEVLSRAQAEAGRLGVQSTPSFFLRQGDGELRPVEVDALTPEAFRKALDAALAAG